MRLCRRHDGLRLFLKLGMGIHNLTFQKLISPNHFFANFGKSVKAAAKSLKDEAIESATAELNAIKEMFKFLNKNNRLTGSYCITHGNCAGSRKCAVMEGAPSMFSKVKSNLRPLIKWLGKGLSVLKSEFTHSKGTTNR